MAGLSPISMATFALSADLHALECDALRIVTADVTEPDSYVDLGFEDGELDALIINAGITGASHQDASKATADEVSHVMMTNAFGPARAAKSLLPAIKDGGTLGVMASFSSTKNPWFAPCVQRWFQALHQMKYP